MNAKLIAICGSMFSEKTETLIREVKRSKIAKQGVQVFKPAMDHRFGVDKIISHGKTDLEIVTGIKPIPIADKNERLTIDNDTKLVAFDEAQFFDTDWILDIIEGLLKDGIRVVCAGLDIDCYGKPFGSMPFILAMADTVIKLKSICSVCQEDGTRTFRSKPFPKGKAIEIGGTSLYEPRCFKCWSPTPKS